MVLFNPYIATTDFYESRFIPQINEYNPVLLKEATFPIEGIVSLNSIVITSNDLYWSYPLYSAPSFKIFESLTDDELTSMCMSVSSKSLNEDWENENDELWESFLKD